MTKEPGFVVMNVRSSRIVFALWAILVLLVIASASSQYIRFTYLDPEVNQLRRFNMDAEGNIPTYFATMILLFSGYLLGTVALIKRRDRDPYGNHWAVLSLLFILMSFDEAASVHEMSIEPLRALLGLSGFLHYAWIIPGAISVVIAGIIYFRFWLNLPSRTRTMFLVAGLCYVFGAIGFEAISGSYIDMAGEVDLTYAFITTAEETLEFSGVILLIQALLGFLSDVHPQTKFLVNFE